MATPQYNIKTGSDSSAYFSREITKSDEADESKLGLIKKEQDTETDYFEYPVLVRRTGDSLKGSTETIESNELRKGRTKSAPRQGNSSSEGSLDFEFSPETYDDILEAAFRNEWKSWLSDKDSKSNLEKLSYNKGYFSMKKLDKQGNVVDVKKRLVGTNAEYSAIKAEVDAGTKTEDDLPLIVTDFAENIEIAELTCGTKEIKYDVLKEYSGADAALYQDFEHMAVNTLDMSVTPGQIVTGSFGFMGSNNPRIVQIGSTGDEENVYTIVDKDTVTVPEAGVQYYTKTDDVYTPVTVADWDPDTDYYTLSETGKPTGLIAELAKYDAHEGRFESNDGPETVKDWIENLPNKGTSTDQYTAREGFLYIDGERVRYGSNLSFNLNNGLEKTFAIFEKDAIALSPLQLDITGSLGAYLIAGYTETLYNLSKDNKDVEVIFCFQDKEDNPDTMYVVQIFKTKFTDTDISSGAENLECTFPFQSFEEKACRIFRIRRKQIKRLERTAEDTFKITLTNIPKASVADEIQAKALVDGEEAVVGAITVGLLNNEYTFTVTGATNEKDVEISVTYNEITKTKNYKKQD